VSRASGGSSSAKTVSVYVARAASNIAISTCRPRPLAAASRSAASSATAACSAVATSANACASCVTGCPVRSAWSCRMPAAACTTWAKPRRSRQDELPKALTETSTVRGFRSWIASQPIPRRSATPGR
jgi:hypothetical protein